MKRRSLLSGAIALGTSTLAPPITIASTEHKPPLDHLVVDGLETSLINKEFLGLLRKGGVHCVHQSVHTLPDIGYLLDVLDENAGEAQLVRTVAEIFRAREAGQIAFFLGSQHGMEIEKIMDKTPMMTRGAMEGAMRAYYEMGLRIQGLCYNVTNIFGGGCLEPESPLTGEGERYVETIHKLGIILDVGGHTGEQTSLDALAISAGVPVVCTHTNAAGLVPNPRASSDRVLETIAGTGGVVGITAISDFQMRSRENYRKHGPRSPRASLDVHLDQYDYLKALIGVDHIGMGPDFFWGSEAYEHQTGNSITFPDYVLSNGTVQTVKGFEDISMVPNLAAGLRGRGWTEEELGKVMGGNWLRVYEQVWGS